MMVLRDIESELLQMTNSEHNDEAAKSEALEALGRLNEMVERIETAGNEVTLPLTIELLDPHGHSMILHDEAKHRELTKEELLALPVGPDPAVFSNEDEP